VAGGLAAGAPQPAPMSLAVRVSGSFIVMVGDSFRVEAAGGGAGAGSGVLHASLPQGFALTENILPVVLEVEVVVVALGAAGAAAAERLNAELIDGGSAGFGAGGSVNGDGLEKGSLDE
jgi:hypothetical protein